MLRHAMRTRLPEQVSWRSDKHHLGWSMTQALMANQREETGHRLKAMRDRLAPYLDLAKLNAQVARFIADGNDDAAPYVFDALRLGGWLRDTDDFSRHGGYAASGKLKRPSTDFGSGNVRNAEHQWRRHDPLHPEPGARPAVCHPAADQLWRRQRPHRRWQRLGQ